MPTDTKLPADELQHVANELRDDWHTGRAVDFEEAVAFHDSLPPNKRFARVLESADMPLLQPRAGVPCLEAQIDLLRYLQDEGSADLLPTTIDSYTRDNQYEKAEEGLAASRNGEADELNGFPDRKSTRLNSSHRSLSRMPSSA